MSPHAVGSAPSVLCIRSLPGLTGSALLRNSAAPAAHGPTATPTAPAPQPTHFSSTLLAVAASCLQSTAAATPRSPHIAAPVPAVGLPAPPRRLRTGR